jgi:hypothetical protein
MDYHWDHHLYFVITPPSHTDYDSLLIPIVTLLVQLLVVSGL